MLALSFRPALLTSGHPEEIVDEWIAKALNDIRTMSPHLYVGVSFAFLRVK